MVNNELIMIVPTASELKLCADARTVEKALAKDEFAIHQTINLFSITHLERILCKLEQVEEEVDHAKSAHMIMDAYRKLHWWGYLCRHNLLMKIAEVGHWIAWFWDKLKGPEACDGPKACDERDDDIKTKKPAGKSNDDESKNPASKNLAHTKCLQLKEF
jgi:hypothetical protein